MLIIYSQIFFSYVFGVVLRNISTDVKCDIYSIFEPQMFMINSNKIIINIDCFII